MKVNNIEVKKVLKFPSAPAFGKYKRFFPAESVAHPAKIHTELLEYLILNYTKEGDTVLDCMCGTGSTVVLSMLNNRNALGIELEEKFTIWAKQAIKNVERQQILTPKGKGMVICGDSRKLSELLKEREEEISTVLFSPPYASQVKGNAAENT
jgi:DNA modification methylase